jgi:hypothetical protein
MLPVSTRPSTVDQWLAVAIARGVDARAIHQAHPKSIGSVYLVGYAIECCLKAYLTARSAGFPKSGSGGHNLAELWRRSGLRLAELGDSDGSRAFFLESWSTNLRYATDHEAGGLSLDELMSGAHCLVGLINQRIRRIKPPRWKR